MYRYYDLPARVHQQVQGSSTKSVMPSIERTVLKPIESARQISPITLVRSERAPVARGTTGRVSRYKVLILFIIFMGLLIFFGNVHLQPTIPTYKQSTRMQAQVTLDTIMNTVKISEERETHIKRSIETFNNVNKNEESMIHIPKIGPRLYTLFDPMYMGRTTDRTEDTSKCYGFDEFARVLDIVTLSHLPEGTRKIFSAHYVIVPLCLRTDGEYHLGLQVRCYAAVPKELYFGLTREMMRFFLMASELAREKRQLEELGYFL